MGQFSKSEDMYSVHIAVADCSAAIRRATSSDEAQVKVVEMLPFGKVLVKVYECGDVRSKLVDGIRVRYIPTYFRGRDVVSLSALYMEQIGQTATVKVADGILSTELPTF